MEEIGFGNIAKTEIEKDERQKNAEEKAIETFELTFNSNTLVKSVATKPHSNHEESLERAINPLLKVITNQIFVLTNNKSIFLYNSVGVTNDILLFIKAIRFIVKLLS